MRHTDAVLLDGPEDNQMYQIPVDDTAMWVGNYPMNFNGWAGYIERKEARDALATSLESFTEPKPELCECGNPAWQCEGENPAFYCEG